MKNQTSKPRKGKSNPNEFGKLENLLKNVVASKRNELVQEMLNMFLAAHPRLADHYEQKIMITRVCQLYIRLVTEVQPMMDKLWDEGEFNQWKQLANPAGKMDQQIDRLMTKLGFTFASQTRLKSEERKSFDPKATNAVQEKVADLIANLKDETDEDEEE